MTQNVTRKIRFSELAKQRFTDAEREKLAGEFTERFEKSGRRFMEKLLCDGDVLICNVTAKLFRIMLEAEW